MKQKLRDALMSSLIDRISSALSAARDAELALNHLIIHPPSGKFQATAVLKRARRGEFAKGISDTEDSMRKAMMEATKQVKRFFEKGTHTIEYEVFCVAGPMARVPIPEEFWKQYEYEV
jgi:hypothetical protein